MFIWNVGFYLPHYTRHIPEDGCLNIPLWVIPAQYRAFLPSSDSSIQQPTAQKIYRWSHRGLLYTLDEFSVRWHRESEHCIWGTMGRTLSEQPTIHTVTLSAVIFKNSYGKSVDTNKRQNPQNRPYGSGNRTMTSPRRHLAWRRRTRSSRGEKEKHFLVL
jgi:hypothetical protein